MSSPALVESELLTMINGRLTQKYKKCQCRIIFPQSPAFSAVQMALFGG
jgi:hypothetical protein